MRKNENAVETIFLWIIRVGLWIIPFLPFYIASSMLFPFITGKNFAFRIIIELAAALWVGVAVANKNYRPKLTPLVKAVTLLMGIIFLADLLGPNPYRSFFSNYERMEGFLMFAHLYLYFLMLVSVFKTRRDWLVFFHASIAASILVCYVALLQRLGLRPSPQGGFRVDSTIGNPTYLAAYLLFHLWLFALLMKQFWPRRGQQGQAKWWWVQAGYASVLLFELAIIFFTATRGVALALLGVTFLFSVALVVWWKRVFEVPASLGVNPARQQNASKNISASGSRKRMYAAMALAVVFAVPVTLWSLRGTSFIQKSQVLNRLTNYSLKEATVNSRFLIWNMSFKGALERPILGWGQENYYLVFQKYYDPGLYAQEPWFDRSHNIIFDWLIHAGFLGLFSYLAIFGAAAWMLIKGLKNRTLQMWEGLVLMGLFLSYFLQNIFVFDNLNTYILFFAFLAYVQYITTPVLAAQPFNAAEKVTSPRAANLNEQRAANRVLIAGIPCLCAALIGVYYLNIRPIRQSQALIRGLQVLPATGSVDKMMDEFKTALAYDSFGTTEVREQLGNISRNIIGSQRFSPEDQKKVLEFTIAELRKEIEKPAKDVKHLLFISSLLDLGIRINPDYAQQAEQSLLEAVKLSPTKQLVYFELAQLYLGTNHPEQAVEALKTAWNQDQSFLGAGANLWLAAVLSKNKEITDEMQAKIDYRKLDEPSLYRVALAYQRVQDFATAITFYEQLVTIAPVNAQYRATYAALLALFNRLDEAKAQVEMAMRLDPGFEKEGQQFLQALEQRKNEVGIKVNDKKK